MLVALLVYLLLVEVLVALKLRAKLGQTGDSHLGETIHQSIEHPVLTY